jgi:hypothetical protein
VRSSSSVFQPFDSAYAQQVGGEQRRLLAALAALDLHDHVAAVVGITRDEQAAQLLLRGRETLLEPGDLGGERLVLFGQLTRGGEVVDGLLPCGMGRGDLAQLGVAPVDLLRTPGIRMDGRVGELLGQFLLFGQ